MFQVARRRKAEVTDTGVLKVSPDKDISEIGDDIIRYLDIQYLHNHVHAVDSPEVHTNNQVLRC